MPQIIFAKVSPTGGMKHQATLDTTSPNLEKEIKQAIDNINNERKEEQPNQ